MMTSLTANITGPPAIAKALDAALDNLFNHRADPDWETAAMNAWDAYQELLQTLMDDGYGLRVQSDPPLDGNIFDALANGTGSLSLEIQIVQLTAEETAVVKQAALRAQRKVPPSE